MNSNDFVSINHILSEVTQAVNDTEYRKGFSKGWFTSRIQDALQELAFDTFYQKLTIDTEFPTEYLAMDMPKGAFNIREIYLYNGDCCTPESSVNVYWKRLYNNNGKGEAYTSKVRDNGDGSISDDPYQPNGRFFNGYYPHAKYYANVQNGMIMFSSACSSFSKVRIVYNGMGGEIGDLPVVPRFFERAINDFVEEKYWKAMKAQDPKLRVLWMDAKSSLEDNVNGSWKKAKIRVAQMDTWEKESLHEYLSAIYHK